VEGLLPGVRVAGCFRLLSSGWQARLGKASPGKARRGNSWQSG
jgi:hypothetical protein